MTPGSNLRISSLAGFLLAAAVIGTVTPAAAQHPCEPDAYRLCNQYIPDQGRVAACLRANTRQLSAGCRAEMRGGRTVSRTARTGKRKVRRYAHYHHHHHYQR